MNCINIAPTNELNEVYQRVIDSLNEGCISNDMVELTMVNGFGNHLSEEQILSITNNIREAEKAQVEGERATSKLIATVVLFGYLKFKHDGIGVFKWGRIQDIHTAYPLSTSLDYSQTLPINPQLYLEQQLFEHDMAITPNSHMRNISFACNVESKEIYSESGGVMGEYSFTQGDDNDRLNIYLYYDYLSVIPNPIWIESMWHNVMSAFHSSLKGVEHYESKLTPPERYIGDALDLKVLGDCKPFLNEVTKNAISEIERSEKELIALQERIVNAVRNRERHFDRLRKFDIRSINDIDNGNNALSKALQKINERVDVEWCMLNEHLLLIQTTDIIIDISEADYDSYVNIRVNEAANEIDDDEEVGNPNEDRDFEYDEDGDIIYDDNGDPIYEDGNPHLENVIRVGGELSDNEISVIEDEVSPGEINIGKLLMEINIVGSGNVVFKNMTRHATGYSGRAASHPHDTGSGEICLGELAGVVPQLIGEFALEDLVDILFVFARSVNVEDVAGQSIRNW